MNSRYFIKTVAISFLAANMIGFMPYNKVFAADNCTVKTRYGTFNGFIDEKGVKTWLGIPFAQPPVGKLRWQSPQPLKPSNKTFDAKKFGFRAVQLDDPIENSDNTIPQSEDCLTLNIWTRGEGKNKPVMFFIHGGTLAFESASDPLYHGNNFAAANDVVLVSFDYRMNVFGFMNFGAIDSAYEDSSCLGLTRAFHKNHVAMIFIKRLSERRALNMLPFNEGFFFFPSKKFLCFINANLRKAFKVI